MALWCAASPQGVDPPSDPKLRWSSRELARGLLLTSRMTQRCVEIAIGRLVTDEELRLRFETAPRETIAALEAEGLDFAPVERAALVSLEVRVLGRFASALDPRLQKANLLPPPRTRLGRGDKEES